MGSNKLVLFNNRKSHKTVFRLVWKPLTLNDLRNVTTADARYLCGSWVYTDVFIAAVSVTITFSPVTTAQLQVHKRLWRFSCGVFENKKRCDAHLLRLFTPSRYITSNRNVVKPQWSSEQWWMLLYVKWDVIVVTVNICVSDVMVNLYTRSCEACYPAKTPMLPRCSFEI